MTPGGADAGVRLLRPAVWPLIWAHALTGFIVAVGPGIVDAGRGLCVQGLAGCGIWSILLVAPSIGMTKLLDPDARISRNVFLPIAWISLGMLLAGLAGSLLIGWRFFEACLAGMVLVVLHAAPPVRLARFWLSNLIMEGFGLGAVTFLAGFVSVGFMAPTPEACLYAVGFLILYLVMRGLLFAEGRMAAPWVGYFGMAAGFAGLVVPPALDRAGWGMLLPLLAAPLWIGAGIRRSSGPGVAPLAVSTGLGIWLATDIAVAFSIIAG